MSMGLIVLKTGLLRFGIVVQSVRFDMDSASIIVEYHQHCVKHTKSVPFSEIEDLFSESPGSPPGAPSVDERAPPGP